MSASECKHSRNAAKQILPLAALVIVLIGLFPVVQLVRSAEARPRPSETAAS